MNRKEYNEMRRIESCKEFPNYLHDKRFPRVLNFRQLKELQTLHQKELEQSLFEQLKADWMAGYKCWMDCEYPWDKPDNRSLGLLIGKLGRYYKNYSSCDIQKVFREYVKFIMTKAPQWYRDNLSMQLIASASKFPVLIKLYEQQTIPKEKRDFVKTYGDDRDFKKLSDIIPNIPVKVNINNNG